MTGVLYRLARFCVHRRFVVLGAWLVVTVALVVISHRLGENTNDNLSLPGTDSQHATQVLKRSFPAQANGTSPIVLHAKTGKLTDPTIKQFGVGLAVAVILDATLVRCLLVPALMVLMGEHNWFMPRWLDRVTPRISIEGAEFFAERDRLPELELEPTLTP